MTIRGDGSSLVTYELAPGTQVLSDMGPVQLNEIVDTLFVILNSDEVDFDTTTGNIEFPFRNGQSDLTGKTTWTRIFPDWVYLKLREMAVNDEVSQAQTLVVNGLYQKARKWLAEN